MNTRNATIKDAHAISAFVSALSNEHISSSLSKAGLDKLLGSMDEAATRKRIVDGWPHICITDESALLAVGVIKPPAHLYHLFVRTDQQRTGIGTKLFMIMDACSVDSFGSHLTTVNSSLYAVEAYRRFGFEVNGPIVETEGIRHQPMVRRIAGSQRGAHGVPKSVRFDM